MGWLELIGNVFVSSKIAARGVLLAAHSQRNFRIHLLAAVAVFGLGFLFRFSREEWILLILTVTMVIMAELLNTGIEFLLNLMESHAHPVVRAAKDVSAGAALIAVLGSVAVGILLFGPKLTALLQGGR